MTNNKVLVEEMSELLGQLKRFKIMYDLNNDKTDVFIQNYVMVTDSIKTDLMRMSSELVGE